MTGVAGAEEIEDSTLDHKASPDSKAFNESRPRRLMSLVLPVSRAQVSGMLSFPALTSASLYFR